jgi:hypothetical protein
LIGEHPARTNVQKLAAAHGTRGRVAKGRRDHDSKRKAKSQQSSAHPVSPGFPSIRMPQGIAGYIEKRSLQTKRKNTIRSAERGVL